MNEILNPNCSEVCFTLSHDGDITEEDLKLLEHNGIKLVTIDGKDYWEELYKDTSDSFFHDPTTVFFDDKNKNQPDFEMHSGLYVSKYDGEGTKTIIGHQDSQHQMFKTMKRMQEILGGRWEGREQLYEEWIGEGEIEVKGINSKKKYKELRKKYDPFK